jgi:hypothetical protein
MALEIKVLVWDRRNNVGELNRFKHIIHRLSVPDLPRASRHCNSYYMVNAGY